MKPAKRHTVSKRHTLAFRAMNRGCNSKLRNEVQLLFPNKFFFYKSRHEFYSLHYDIMKSDRASQNITFSFVQ